MVDQAVSFADECMSKVMSGYVNLTLHWSSIVLTVCVEGKVWLKRSRVI